MNSVGRFDGKVADYDRYRERYSPEILLPVLRERTGLTAAWKIADIGAGTGMLSDVFLANGNRVVAVEPNPEMRAACAALHTTPQLAIIEGTAEETGLADSSVDMVTAGRAMHWFDIDPAMEEFRRILKPDGWIAIIAFGRTEHGHEENEAFEMLLRQHSDDHADTHAGYTVYHRLSSYLPRDFFHQELISTMTLDWDGVHGYAMSLSASPTRAHRGYPAFERSLRDFFQHYSRDGKVILQTRYWINLGRFAPR